MRSFLILICFLPFGTIAQSRLHISVFGGTSNYQGDLQPKRFTYNQSKFAFGGGLRYDLTERIALRGELKYGQLQAADSLNPPNLRSRNLSFQSKLYEASLLAEYSFGDILERKMVPYIFGGIAVFHFSPYTTYNGRVVYLQPLGTEGQGLAAYPEKKKYKLNQFSIPAGAGIRFAVNQNVDLSFELGYRLTFTDYIDDVSGSFADQNLLRTGNGQLAVDVSYRSDELKDGNPLYPAEGTKRGGKFKDSYYFTGITAAFRIFDIGYKNRSYQGKNNGRQMDCYKF
jgi:opacity protein-like surface antigen